MRDNLHKYIINDPDFPENPEIAIKNACLAADKAFLSECLRGHILEDFSGTCACIILFVEDQIYTVNIGDSRSVISSKLGAQVDDLTLDHKPNSKSERDRILAASGRIYKYVEITVGVQIKMSVLFSLSYSLRSIL